MFRLIILIRSIHCVCPHECVCVGGWVRACVCVCVCGGGGKCQIKVVFCSVCNVDGKTWIIGPLMCVSNIALNTEVVSLSSGNKR